MTGLVIRALAAHEEHLFDSLPDPGLVGFAAGGDTYTAMSRDGQYRPEWTWVALRAGRVVARAAWWGGPDDEVPSALDWFDFTDAEAAVELLRAAPLSAQYSLRLPPAWRDRPDVRAAALARIDAASAAGLEPLVERYRYRWTPDCGIPERPGRLEFRPEPDDDAFLDAFRRINEGSLDAHVRRTTAESGREAAARQELEYLRWLPGDRDLWRLAYAADGHLVGLSVPSRNHDDPLVAYIGVVPEQRGRRFAYDLLVEATHALADAGVDRIIAGTDVTNTPMAATFARARYPVAQHRIDMVPADSSG